MSWQSSTNLGTSQAGVQHDRRQDTLPTKAYCGIPRVALTPAGKVRVTVRFHLRRRHFARDSASDRVRRQAALRTRWCWPASGVAHTVVLAGERRCTRGGAGRSDAPHDGVGRCSAPKQPAEALMPLNEAMNLPRWPEPQ